MSKQNHRSADNEHRDGTPQEPELRRTGALQKSGNETEARKDGALRFISEDTSATQRYRCGRCHDEVMMPISGEYSRECRKVIKIKCNNEDCRRMRLHTPVGIHPGAWIPFDKDNPKAIKRGIRELEKAEAQRKRAQGKGKKQWGR